MKVLIAHEVASFAVLAAAGSSAGVLGGVLGGAGLYIAREVSIGATTP